MTGKSQALYEELFCSLNTKCAQLGFHLDPSVVVSDFELAVIGAVGKVFGSHVTTRCCFYHLTQSTWRRVQQSGLTTEYKENQELRHFCGMLDGLAFLPLCDVEAGMSYLRSVTPVYALPVLNYFDSTYVSGSYRPVLRPDGGIRMAFRPTPPAFPPALWNVYDATLSGTSRTNNICESWNNGYRTLVGHVHPCVWTSIDAIRKDQATVSTLIQQHVQGVPPKKRIRRESADLQKRLFSLCAEYRDGKRNLQSFLRAVGHNIRLF